MRLIPPSLRGLFKTPGFSLLVVFTLALGIGANAGVFSIVYGVLFQRLPYDDPDRLLRLFESKAPNDLDSAENISPAAFLDWQQRNHVFSGIAVAFGMNYNLVINGHPEHLDGAAASANLFPVLGVQPLLGRGFLPEEDAYSAPHVVVLSHHLWTERFGANPKLIGTSISINGEPYTVVGVMPANFAFPDYEDIWIPLQRQIRPDRMQWRWARFLTAVGRLRPGVSIDQARAEMNLIASTLQRENSSGDVDPAATILPLQYAEQRGARENLTLAAGISLIVLLIACANASTLMLIRISGKTRDMGVRLALGARTSQVLREPLLQSLWLGIAAGIVGILLAIVGRRLLLVLAPVHATDFDHIQLSPPVLAFTFVLSAFVGLLFGVIPALAVVRADLQDSLRKTSRTATVDVKGRRLRDGLIVVEIALSVLLLTGSGLIVRSLLALRQVPLGVNPAHVISARFSLPRIKYQDDKDVLNFYGRAMEEIRAMPGIEDASLTTQYPLWEPYNADFAIAGKTTVGQYDSAFLVMTDSYYISAMSIPLVRGRFFSTHDRATSEPVVVVNQVFADRFFKNDDAVGKQLAVSRGDDLRSHNFSTIVGVIGNVRNQLMEDPAPTIYVPYEQMPFHSMRMVVRSRLPLLQIDRLLQAATQKVDPNVPVFELVPVETLVSDSFEPWRYALLLIGVLAALALLLTLVGLFGVISFIVRARTKELAIRVAMGADHRAVFRLILGKGLLLTLAGLVPGLIATLIFGRFLDSLLYNVTTHDFVTFTVVSALLAATGLMASYLPAHRATRLDPAKVLGEE